MKQWLMVSLCTLFSVMISGCDRADKPIQSVWMCHGEDSEVPQEGLHTYYEDGSYEAEFLVGARAADLKFDLRYVANGRWTLDNDILTTVMSDMDITELEVMQYPEVAQTRSAIERTIKTRMKTGIEAATTTIFYITSDDTMENRENGQLVASCEKQSSSS